MIIQSFDQLHLGRRSHLSSLIWLGLLYRRPLYFRTLLAQCSTIQMVKAGFLLTIHALPYLIFFAGFARVIISPTFRSLTEVVGFASGLIRDISVGLAGGIVLIVFSTIGLALEETAYLGVVFLAIVGVAAFGILGGVAFGIVVGVVSGTVGALLFGGFAWIVVHSFRSGEEREPLPYAVRYALAGIIALGMGIDVIGGPALAVAGGSASGVAYGIATGSAIGIVGGIAIGKAIRIAPAVAIALIGGVIGMLFSVGFGVSFAIAFIIMSPRVYYIFLHLYLIWFAPILEGALVSVRTRPNAVMRADAEAAGAVLLDPDLEANLSDLDAIDYSQTKKLEAAAIKRAGTQDPALVTRMEIARRTAVQRLEIREEILSSVSPSVAQRYSFHPVFWDDLCGMPFPGLQALLVRYTDDDPDTAAVEINRLIESYPSQRAAAVRAKTISVAAKMGREANLAILDTMSYQLPEGKQGFLKEIPQLREMIAQVARRQRELNTVQRAIFREPLATALLTEIDNFRHRAGNLREPLASSFRAAAARWFEVADRELRDAHAVVTKTARPQVFRAGNPVDRDHEAFVPRLGVIGELEGQLMLANGCPGLLLYGRRRTGKSTTLKNLAGFIPQRVNVVVLSMQDPESFISFARFVRRVGEGLMQPWPGEAPRSVDPDLIGLMAALVHINAKLKEENRRLLLAIDEYENLDEKIGSGEFPSDLLALFREAIQEHRNITWIFAGSHHISELRRAPWASYLVSARTIEMSLFSGDESRMLLTDPLSYSSLWQGSDAKRPRFPAEVWGAGGVERIHAEAGGWPHLLQLIAETTIDLLNDSKEQNVDAALLERALDRAIVRGDLVLRQLVQNECESTAEWDYIRRFRRLDKQPIPEDELIYQSLRRRLLVTEEENGFWQLRVPIMRRWLQERG